MKTFATVLGFFLSLNAYALYVPGAEKPFLRAAMQVKASGGEFSSAPSVEIIMTRHDGSNEPSGMVMMLNGKPHNMVILDMRRGKCGDTEFLAIRYEDLKNISFERMKIELHDHSTRQCDDVKANRWDARIQHLVREGSNDEPKVVGSLQIAGNPKAVITIQ